jgi:RHS repeat-associated protein
MKTKQTITRILLNSLLITFFGHLLAEQAQAQIGGAPPSNYDVSPTMNTDVSTMITTGNAYDAWTGSPHRVVTDFSVPGTVGEHGLKWTRTWTAEYGWSFAYTWRYFGRHAILVSQPGGSPSYQYDGGKYMIYPDGRRSKLLEERGVQDRLIEKGGFAPDHADVVLEDGSDIYMENYAEDLGPDGSAIWVDHFTPTQITDRYGRITTLNWQGYANNWDTYPYSDHIRLTEVDDPSGRWIKIVYGNAVPTQPTLVYGSDGQWVQYVWTTVTWVLPDNSQVSGDCLTDVYYSDGTSAHYTYTYAGYVAQGSSTINYWEGLLATAQDTHAEGPMRSIQIDYASPGNWQGEILDERDLTSGAIVTSCDHTIHRPDTDGVRTETRGDGPSRHIHMTKPNPLNDPTNQAKQPPLVMSKEDYNGVQEQYSYDDHNYLKSVIDRNGNQTTYTTDTVEPKIGIVTSIIHPDLTHIDYAYNEPLATPTPTPSPVPINPVPSQTQNDLTDQFNPYYISTVSNERGFTTTYTRDHVRRPDGTISHLVTRIDYPHAPNDPVAFETFTYNGLGQLIVHQRKNGAYDYAQYDSSGLLTDLWNPTTSSPRVDSEPHTHYDYYTAADYGGAWQDRVKTVTDPIGYRTVYTYDYLFDANGVQTTTPCPGRGLVTSISYLDDTHGGAYPGGTLKSFVYDIYGNKLSETDELLHPTSYSYDHYNRLQNITDALGNITQLDYTPPAKSPYSHTTKSVYKHTPPPTASAPNGIITAQTVDNNFRLATKTEASGTSLAATSYYGFDANGNQTTFTDPRGTSLGDPNYTTTTGYDNRNRKHTLTDPLSHVTTWNYDSASNVTSILRPDSTTESKQYDSMNRVLTDTVPRNSAQDTMTTSFIYFPAGTLNTVTDGNGHVTTFLYDPDDLKTDMGFQNGDHEIYAYDANHRLLTRKTTSVSPITYQKFSYDARDRKTEMWWGSSPDPNNHSDDISWFNGITHNTYSYDKAGRMLSANNAFSAVSRQYDDANRLTHDTQAVAGSTSYDVVYSPDAAGEITAVNIPSVYNLGILYDPMGRMWKLSNAALGTFETYVYDPASNITERDTASTGKLLYPRDSLNRIYRRDVVLGTSMISSESYAFDAMSRLVMTTRTEDNKKDAFGYDMSGQLTSAQYAIAQPTPTPSPTPTPPPTPTPTPTPPPNQVAPVVITPTAGDAKIYMSDATSGATIFYTVSNTTFVDPTHNGGTPTGTTHIYTGPINVSGVKNFSALGYKSGMTDSGISQYGADNAGGNMMIRLPGGGAMAQFSLQSRTVNYTLDKVGNRTNVNDSVTGSVNYSPDNINRYTQVGTNSVTSGPEHQVGAYQSNTYRYVSDTFLAQVSSGSNIYGLGYDALGRCVKRTLNNSTTYYIYDGDKAILETGATSATNVYGVGIDEIVLRTVGSTNYYFYQDHEGSITHVTNGSTLVEQYRYDVFGLPTIADGSGNVIASSAIGNRFMFTGREYAVAFGIYEYRNRAYHPGLGRFMSEDPKGFDAKDYNLFRYVHNDPEDLTDAMGLQEMDPEEVAREETNPGEAAAENARESMHEVSPRVLAAMQEEAELNAAMKARQERVEREKEREKEIAAARKDKDAGQNYEEMADAQQKARQQGERDRINRIEKSRQKDKQDIKDEAERALKARQQNEKQKREKQGQESSAPEPKPPEPKPSAPPTPTKQ